MIALSPDQRFVVTNAETDDGIARVWDVRSGTLVSELKGEEDAVEAVSFSPDSRFVLTSGPDKTALLWDAATGKRIREFDGHSGNVKGVAFWSGNLILTEADGTVHFWDIAKTSEIGQVTASASYGREPLAVSHDRRFPGLARRGLETIDIWDLSNRTIVRTIDARVDGYHDIVSLDFSPDGRSLLAAGGEEAWLQDVGTGARLRRFEGHTGLVTSAAFSPDGRFVTTSSADGSNRLWDEATGRWLASMVSFKDGSWAVVDPEGRFDTNNPDGSAPLHWIAPDGRCDPAT